MPPLPNHSASDFLTSHHAVLVYSSPSRPVLRRVAGSLGEIWKGLPPPLIAQECRYFRSDRACKLSAFASSLAPIGSSFSWGGTTPPRPRSGPRARADGWSVTSSLPPSAYSF